VDSVSRGGFNAFTCQVILSSFTRRLIYSAP
jgi:hypothetical protein